MSRGVTHAAFGRTTNGTPVEIYTLTNANGIELRAMTYAGIITSLKVPDRSGTFGGSSTRPDLSLISRTGFKPHIAQRARSTLKEGRLRPASADAQAGCCAILCVSPRENVSAP
jgi:hypothetical protein